MIKKIFYSIFLIPIIIFILSISSVLIIMYHYHENELKSYLDEMLNTVSVFDINEDNLKYISNKNIRITLVSKSGEVLYDSVADKDSLNNHIDRLEIKESLLNGYGRSERFSETLEKKSYYVAKKLSDGNILRMAMSEYSFVVLFLFIIRPLALIIVFMIIIDYILSKKISDAIISPLNNIDIENPKDSYIYDEIKPFVMTIKHQREQLKKDEEELNKNEIIRQEFTANVSHELKTPLHVISGYAELINKGMVKEDDIKKFSEIIFNESKRLTNIVGDIIMLSQIDSAQDINKEKVNLLQVVKNAVDSLAFFAKEMNIGFKIIGEDTYIDADPKLLYEIIYNLCDNAIKYNHTGGNVEIKIENFDTKKIISIKDTGIGIKEEDTERIFERFYRVDKSRSKENAGTGLGLSIVKHGLKIHNATIYVKSKINIGSEFIITFFK